MKVVSFPSALCQRDCYLNGPTARDLPVNRATRYHNNVLEGSPERINVMSIATVLCTPNLDATVIQRGEAGSQRKCETCRPVGLEE